MLLMVAQRTIILNLPRLCNISIIHQWQSQLKIKIGKHLNLYLLKPISPSKFKIQSIFFL